MTMSNNDSIKRDPEKGRKLALFLDGTWNRPFDRTNVFTLYELADGYDEYKLGRYRYRHWKKAGSPIIEEDLAVNPPTKKDRSDVEKRNPETRKDVRRQLWDDHLRHYINANQIKFYDKGIGTGFFSKFLGGVFGAGLTDNIIQAYRFICRHYKPDDELYIFGFSRGSYTARSLTGVLDLIGIIRTQNEALTRNLQYRAFRDSDYSAVVCYYKYFTALIDLLDYTDEIKQRKLNRKITKRLSQMIKTLKSTRFSRKYYSPDELGVHFEGYIDRPQYGHKKISVLEILSGCLTRVKKAQLYQSGPDYGALTKILLNLKKLAHFNDSILQPPVKFLGVFDTVGALGIPKSLLSRVFRYMDFHRFHNTTLSPVVQNAFHALAIDEQRIDFIPTLFHKNGRSEQNLVQMWFAGAHSNVGGGYEDSFLSRIPGRWMQAWAEHHGLKFQGAIRCGPSDLTEPVVDSRIWPFNRRGPAFRFIPLNREKDDDEHFIHSSVHQYVLQNRDYFPSALTQGKLEKHMSRYYDWPDKADGLLLDPTNDDEEKPA